MNRIFQYLILVFLVYDISSFRIHSPRLNSFASGNKFSTLFAKKKRANKLLAEDILVESTFPDTKLDITEVPPTDDIDFRVGLKAEIASPLRKVRQFFYVAFGLAGGLGLFTAVPQLIFSLQGGEGVESPTSALLNIAVDLGGIIGGILLWDREGKAEAEQIQRFSNKEKISSYKLSSVEIKERENLLKLLPVEIQISEDNMNITRIVPINDLQEKGQQNIIILAGNAEFIKDSLIAARIEGLDFFINKNIFIVPAVVDVNDDNNNISFIDEKEPKGFAAKENFLTAAYIGKPMQPLVWSNYLSKEFAVAKLQGAKDVATQGLVLVVNNQGTIIRRGLGLPPWKKVVEDLNTNKTKK